MRTYLCLLVLFLWAKNSTAQFTANARLTAMGHSAAAVNDIGSVNGNPAFARVNYIAIQLNHHQSVVSKHLHQQGMAVVFPFQKNNAGFYIERYGIPDFYELQGSMLISRTFDSRLSLGCRGNLRSLKISNYEIENHLWIDVGLRYQFDQGIQFGFYADHLHLKSHSDKTNALISQNFHAGVTFQTHARLLLASTLTYSTSRVIQVGGGLEYGLLDILWIRTGVGLNPFHRNLGIGLAYQKLTMDLSFTTHSNLGVSSIISVGYAF